MGKRERGKESTRGSLREIKELLGVVMGEGCGLKDLTSLSGRVITPTLRTQFSGPKYCRSVKTRCGRGPVLLKTTVNREGLRTSRLR